MRSGDDLSISTTETAVENELWSNANNSGMWVFSAEELKRAYDALRELADAAQKRRAERACHLPNAESTDLDIDDCGGSSPWADSGSAWPELAAELSDLQDSSLRSVSLMLFGLAIENLLKGIIVKRVRVDVDKGKLKIPGANCGHDLGKLADLCAKERDIVLEEDDRATLDVLSQYSLWAGRYMVPKNLKAYTQYLRSQEREDVLLETMKLDELYARIHWLAIK